MAEAAPEPNKVFAITDIKSHIPLQLDLDRQNYYAWRELFSTHCIGFDVIDHIDNTYKEPAPKPDDPKWRKVDSTVKHWIYRTISQSLLELVVKKDSSARDVWIGLEKLFYVDIDVKAMQLENELRNVSMGDLSLTDYFSKIKTISDLLDNIGAPVVEENLVMYTINGLSSKFENAASTIQATNPLPSFLETRSMLLLEEEQMADQEPAPSSPSTPRKQMADQDPLPSFLETRSMLLLEEEQMADQDPAPSSPSTPRKPNLPDTLYGDLRTCRLLEEAAFVGDWEAAKAILYERPYLVRFAINGNQETLLHCAATAENTKQTQEFVENLVNIMKVEDLELENDDSYNPLQIAAVNGSIEMVDAILKKNQALLRIPNMKNDFPITESAYYGHHELTRHLYQLSEGTLDTYLNSDGLNRFVRFCIRSQMFDMALKILTDFRDKITDKTYMSILDGLARRPNSLYRPKQNMIWKIIDLFFVKLHMNKEPSESDDLALNVLKQVLDNICTTFNGEDQLLILKGPTDNGILRHPSGVLFVAVEMGNTAFVIELLQVYPHLLTTRNENDETIFHVAIMHRHHDIYNLLYEIGGMRLASTTYDNKQGNTLLHLVAKSSKGSQPQTSSGASLLMQRELLWFQDVEKMLPPVLRESKNNNGQTAYDIFFEEKKDLISSGLKWMKDCMVTATLIVTVAFAVAFTVPGGYHQDTGFPMFLHKTSFLVFVIADAVSLFSSSTSLLVFLSILTSHHGHRDFLYSLPRKLMIGLLTLFISVVAMMVTFSASFFVLYNNRLKWVPILISILAVVPVIIYAAFQLPVWSDMFLSTFYSRYLFNPGTRMLFNKSKRV